MNLYPIFDKFYVQLSICIILTALLLFVGLGSFGIWEPAELAHAETAERIMKGQSAEESGLSVEARLAAVSWRALGQTELAARLPVALIALITLTALFLLMFPLVGGELTTIAVLFLMASPLFLFHGRQLTEGMPRIASDVLAIGGLALGILSRRRAVVAAGLSVGIIGLGLGLLSRGALEGVAAPLLSVALSLLLSGQGTSFMKSDEKEARRAGLIALVTGVLGLFVTGGYLAVVLSKADLPLLTAGAVRPIDYKMTFDFPLEQIAYGWYPWCALVPLSILGYFRAEDESPRMCFMRALSISGILVGYLAHAISLEFIGLSPASVVVPMALAAAFAVYDLVRAASPLRLLVFLGVVLFALLLRDFFQNPDTLFYSFGWDDLPIPEKDYKPLIVLGFFALPAGLLIATGFLADGAWRRWQFSVLLPLAPVVFGAGISFYLVPYYSIHLSSKHAIKVYEKYRTDSEPLAVYGPSHFFSDARKLDKPKDVVEWLSRDDRVFALFPPRNLPDFDQKMRAKTGGHLFVLDAESDRFMVATSKPLKKEKNRNPLAGFARSKPFEPGPSHPLSVNFDDKLTLLGWDLKGGGRTDRLERGKEMVFTSYWQVKKRVGGDYKFFMHIDGPGGRIHGDHDPFEGEFPTGKWTKGDYIKEVYKKTIPVYQSVGEYTIRMGFYKGSGRLPVKDEPTAKENSVLIGKFVLD